MARPLRIQYEGALYHVTCRGNERKVIFKDNRDKKVFLDLLSDGLKHTISPSFAMCSWITTSSTSVFGHKRLPETLPAQNPLLKTMSWFMNSSMTYLYSTHNRQMVGKVMMNPVLRQNKPFLVPLSRT